MPWFSTGKTALSFSEDKLRELEDPDLQIPKITIGNRDRFSGAKATSLGSRWRLLAKIVREDVFFAPVQVNGKKGSLLIDTGAPLTVLNPHFAYRTGVRVSRDASGSIGFESHVKADISLGVADDFDIGEIAAHDVLVMIPHKLIVPSLFGICLTRWDGLLGLDLLSGLSTTFDFRDSVVVFSRNSHQSAQDACRVPIEVQLRKEGGMPVLLVKCSLNGERDLQCQIDTGASGEISIPPSLWSTIMPDADARRTVDVSLGGMTPRPMPASRSNTESEWPLISFGLMAGDGRSRLVLDLIAGYLYFEH